MPINNNTLTYRVGQLEKNYDDLDHKIDKLLTNHLPHLERQLVAIKTEARVLAVINSTAIIIGIILSRMFL